jgi:hypothetical protein
MRHFPEGQSGRVVADAHIQKTDGPVRPARRGRLHDGTEHVQPFLWLFARADELREQICIGQSLDGKRVAQNGIRG